MWYPQCRDGEYWWCVWGWRYRRDWQAPAGMLGYLWFLCDRKTWGHRQYCRQCLNALTLLQRIEIERLCGRESQSYCRFRIRSFGALRNEFDLLQIPLHLIRCRRARQQSEPPVPESGAEFFRSVRYCVRSSGSPLAGCFRAIDNFPLILPLSEFSRRTNHLRNPLEIPARWYNLPSESCKLIDRHRPRQKSSGFAIYRSFSGRRYLSPTSESNRIECGWYLGIRQLKYGKTFYASNLILARFGSKA